MPTSHWASVYRTFSDPEKQAAPAIAAGGGRSSSEAAGLWRATPEASSASS